MLEGLEILIARMETNPDEFIYGEWDYFFEDHPLNSEIFTEEELKAWDGARERLTAFKREKNRRFFTEQVIRRLMERDNRERIVMEKEWGRP